MAKPRIEMHDPAKFAGNSTFNTEAVRELAKIFNDDKFASKTQLQAVWQSAELAFASKQGLQSVIDQLHRVADGQTGIQELTDVVTALANQDNETTIAELVSQKSR